MSHVILHPTASTPVPVTLIAAGRTGKPRATAKPARMRKADLAALVIARGLKVTTKHNMDEMRQMLTTGVQVQAAAYVRDLAARKAKRAADRAAKA